MRSQDASQAVAERCYAGPWLCERAATRRVRLGIMQSASRTSGMHVYTNCVFDRPTCGEAVRRWFSYIQVLINLSSR